MSFEVKLSMFGGIKKEWQRTTWCGATKGSNLYDLARLYQWNHHVHQNHDADQKHDTDSYI